MSSPKLQNIKQSLKSPRRVGRAYKIFWAIFLAPFAIIALMLILIAFGVFGKLPSFEELENPKSNIATEVMSADGKNLGNFFIQNRSYVDYQELSPNLVAALIATEDARFYGHSGIDFLGLTRVVFRTVLMGDRGQGGGSTITQQLAKNLYPRDTASSSGVAKAGKLVVSKLKEWITAVMLEHNYTKQEIVVMYLNTVEYGSNAFGIKSAARTFFNKEPRDLTVDEAALLVGVVNAPTRYSPVRNPKNALSRRNKVIERMGQAGFISKDHARQYAATPIMLDYKPISHNEGTATYFREMVRLYLTAERPVRKSFANDFDYQADLKRWDSDPLYGWCSKNLKADGTQYNLYKDGLKIYTTIDSRMQQYAEEAVQMHMGGSIQPTFDRQRKAQGGNIFLRVSADQKQAILRSAMMQSDRGRMMRQSGASEKEIADAFAKKEQMRVFTYHGERDTVMTPMDSIIHSKAILRTGFMAMNPSTGHVQAWVGGPNFRHFKYDMVRQGRRQIGSTVKPFIYTFAFDHLGLSPNTMVPNFPVTIETASGDAWTPREASVREYDGVMHPLRWGMANSRNNYSAWIMKQSAPEAVANLMHKMGITTYIDPVPALCTGTPEVTLMELVGAFSTFANKGVHTEPMFVTRIEDKQGNVLSSFSPASHDAISESTAYLMLDMLQSVISAGTGGRLRYQFNIMGQVGGKTGTTNNNADAWFVGIAPKVAAGAWVGGEERSTHLSSGGEGSVATLPIFGHFMRKVYADKTLGISPDDKFTPPVGGVNFGSSGDESATASDDGSTAGVDEFFE